MTEQKESKKDINFIQHEKRIEYGCSTGQHRFEIEEMKAVGNLTRIKLVCQVCNKENFRDEVLNINDFLQETEQELEQKVKDNIPLQKPESTEKVDELNNMKSRDEFWEGIKKGK